MINNKEFRIGNLVHHMHEGILHEGIEIEEIFKNGVNLRNVLWGASFEELFPVPLTEEWILKFGFVKYKQGKKYSKDDPFYGVDLHGFELYYNEYYSDEIIIGKKDGNFNLVYVEYKEYDESIIQPQYKIKFEYVHTLQNVCFFLTAKELTVNAPVPQT